MDKKQKRQHIRRHINPKSQTSLRLRRNDVAMLFANNQSLASASLAIVAGGIYGRALGNIRSIFRILKEQKIIRLE